MARTDKIEYLRLLDEKVRRLVANPLKVFKAFAHQIAFLSSMQKYRETWLIAGNRSGKTVIGAVAVVKYAMSHPFENIWVVSPSFEVQRDVSQRYIEKYLPEGSIKNIKYRSAGVIDYIEIQDGSRIGFKSCDQGRAKFQGTSINLIWFDEEPMEDIYNECLLRTVDCDGKIIGTMTPVDGMTWSYEKIYKPSLEKEADIKIIHATIYDNKTISRKMIDMIGRKMTQFEKDIRFNGKYVTRYGLVFSHFNEMKHYIKPFPIPKDWGLVGAIDHGIDHPAAFLLYAIDYEHEKAYCIEEYREKNKTIGENAKAILAITRRYPNNPAPIFMIDPATQKRVETTGRTVRQIYADNGIKTMLADNDVSSGIDAVNEMFYFDNEIEPQMYIFNTLTMFKAEIDNYIWDKNSNGDKPVKKKDDLMDCHRYFSKKADRFIYHRKMRAKMDDNRIPYEPTYSSTGY